MVETKRKEKNENVIEQPEKVTKVKERDDILTKEQPVLEKHPVRHEIEERTVPVQKEIEHEPIITKEREKEKFQEIGSKQAEHKRQQELKNLQRETPKQEVNKEKDFKQTVDQSKETLDTKVRNLGTEVQKDVVIKPEVTEQHYQPFEHTIEKPVKQMIHQEPVVRKDVGPTVVKHEKQPPLKSTDLK
ncbi:hypothetical protein ABK040_014544 [Willaertia magna]